MPSNVNSATTRAILAAIVLFAGLALGWFGHKTLAGAADVPIIAIYQDWRVACPPSSAKDASCEMQVDIPDPKTHASVVARLSVIRIKGDNKLIVRVPFNLFLEPGLALFIGKDKPTQFRAQYETCDGAGCIATAPFDDALGAMLATSVPSNLVVMGLDGKEVGIPFSTKGYSDAAAAYEGAEARRHSWWRRLWS